MKKTFLLLNLLLMAALGAAGQVPQSFSYQAAVRNADGTPMANRSIAVRIELITGTTVHYAERHASVPTGPHGVISLAVGSGAPLAGAMAQVPWATGQVHIRVSVDPNNGTAYALLGSSQILSVPYAMHAGSSASTIDGQIAITKDQVVVSALPDRNPAAALFAVLNSAGDTLFAVYEDRVAVYIDENTETKRTRRAGFAVGGRNPRAKGEHPPLFLEVTPDSTRVFFHHEGDDDKRTRRAGFAVGGRNPRAKAADEQYFSVGHDTVVVATPLMALARVDVRGPMRTADPIGSLPVTAPDGAVIETVQIGRQTWTQRNLATHIFNNGDPIPSHWHFEVADTAGRPPIPPPHDLGLLYTDSVAQDPRGVCPAGWRVPTQADWEELIRYTGGAGAAIASQLDQDHGGHWTPGWAGTNTTGFTAHPTGIWDSTLYAQTGIGFTGYGQSTAWWAAGGTAAAELRYVFNEWTLRDELLLIITHTVAPGWAFPIRCVKEPANTTPSPF